MAIAPKHIKHRNIGFQQSIIYVQYVIHYSLSNHNGNIELPKIKIY